MIQFREVEGNESFPSLCDELREFISNQLSDFKYSLIADLSHIDQRAATYEDPEIESITHKYDNCFILNYSYEYYIDKGCSDFNEQGTKSESVSFTLDRNGTIKIEIPDITNARGYRIYD
ncbi:hypothetical protein B0D95_10190 [Cellvibrio sp. PSBB023]|nr:hypothetical protein B0D95_10190 [Cellvibrio sp. PSBB023]